MVFGLTEVRFRFWHPLKFLLKRALIVRCAIPNSANQAQVTFSIALQEAAQLHGNRAG